MCLRVCVIFLVVTFCINSKELFEVWASFIASFAMTSCSLTQPLKDPQHVICSFTSCQNSDCPIQFCHHCSLISKYFLVGPRRRFYTHFGIKEMFPVTDWLTDRQNGWPTHWQNGWPTDRFADRLTGWTTNWLTDRQTGWPTDWLADGLADWMTGRQTGWPTNWLTGR